MLQRMREAARGVVGKIIAVALILVLTVFGFGAVSLFAPDDPAVVDVGGREVSQREYSALIERQRQRLMSEGQDPADIDDDALRGQILDELIMRAVRLNEAEVIGTMFPENAIGSRIVEETAFHDADGRFDPQLFRSRLSQAGYTLTTYQESLGEDLANQLLAQAIYDSGFATGATTRTLARVIRESRDVAWLLVKPETFEDGIEISDDDLASWFAQEQSRFVEPEQATLEVLRFSGDDLLDAVTVTDEEVTAAFNQEVDEAVSNERRDARHILLSKDERTDDESMALAQQLLGQLRDGADFAALARQYSGDKGSAEKGGDLGYAGRGVYVPPFEEALWALAEGELSAPVVSRFGVHLIQLMGIQTDPPPAFADRQGPIRQRLLREAAGQLYTERLLEFEDWVYESNGLAEVATEFGLNVEKIDQVARVSGTGPAVDDAVRAAAFSPRVLQEGRNSDVLTVGDGAVAVRVVAHIPERQQSLDEVRDDVRAALLRERAVNAAGQAADAALQQLRDGKATATVASDLGTSWVNRAGLLMDQAVGVPPEVLKSAFALPAPADGDKSLDLVQLDDDSRALVTVTQVTAGDFDALPEADQGDMADLAVRYNQGTESSAYFAALRDATDIRRR